MRKSKAAIKKACYDKHRYGTSRQAEAAVARVSKRLGKPFDMYPCLKCGGWHITSRR